MLFFTVFGWLANRPVFWPLPSCHDRVVRATIRSDTIRYDFPPPQRKPQYCLARGHEQVVRTVRASANGKSFECVQTGEIQSGKNEGFKFYFRLKPGAVRIQEKRKEEWSGRCSAPAVGCFRC